MNRKIVNSDIEGIFCNELAWHRLANKTILITGANGFLPAYIIETLCHLNEAKRYNIKILAFARNKEKTLIRFTNYLNRSYLTFFFKIFVYPLIYL